MAFPNPKINSNLTGDLSSPYAYDYAFLQKGYTYGVNDSGPWQKFSREGLLPYIQNWATILNNAGWTWTVTLLHTNTGGAVFPNNTGLAKIEAQAGWAYPYLYGTETPENIWELDPQDEQKALLSADFPNGSINLTTYYPIGGAPVDMTSLKTKSALANIIGDPNAKWYANGSKYNSSGYGIVITTNSVYVFDDGQVNFPIPNAALYAVLGFNMTIPLTIDSTQFIRLPGNDYAASYSLYLLEKAGFTDYPFEASVIRHSMLTSNLYAVQASYSNMNRIISSGSMSAIEGTPGTLLFAVPTMPTPLQFVETPGDLQYGWRKVRPQVARLSRMKWRVAQNYQLGLWPVKVYGNVL